MHLIERNEHLLRLDELASRSFTGEGRIALLSGPPSTGRTALLQTFTERMPQRGVLVLSASCTRAEHVLVCGVISQLMQSAPLPDQLGGVAAQLLQTVITRAVQAPEPATDDQDLLQLLHGMCLRFLELSARQPLIIAIDDIDYADSVSLRFLQQIIRRLRRARILVVLTSAGDGYLRDPALDTELRGQQHVDRIAVPPLSRDGVRELLSTHVSEDTAQRLAAEFLAATGGNPLLLGALIADHCERAQGSDRFGQAVLNCLHRSDPLLLDVARAIAVLGDDAQCGPLRSLVDADQDNVSRALRMMTAAGLLDGGAFRHPAARRAVLEQMPADARAAWHRNAAQVLAEAGASASAIAPKLLEAGGVPPRRAVPVLLEAAEHARADCQMTRSAAYLELALQAGDEPSRVAATRARLAQIEWEINPSGAARHLTPLAAAARAGQLDRCDGLALVRQLLWLGRMDEAADLLGVLRPAMEHDPGSAPTLHGLEQWLAFTYPPLARRLHLVEAPAADTSIVLAPAADSWLQSASTLAGLLTRGRIAEAVEPAKQALGDMSLGRRNCWADESALIAFLVLNRSERLDLVTHWCDQLAVRMDGEKMPMWRAIGAVARAEGALGRGDLSCAVGYAQTALSALPAKTWGTAVTLPLAVLVLACSRLGRLDKAGAYLAQPVPDAVFQSRYCLPYLYARGQHRLAIGQPHAALADFVSCGDLVRGWGLDATALVQWRTGAAEAWLRLGNKAQARRLLSEQMTQPGGDSARSRGVALRLLASASPADRRPPLLKESLELAESCNDRFEQVRALADLIEAYRALADNRRARMLLRRGLHMAQACQAEPMYRELLSVSDEVGEAASSPGGETSQLAVLSSSERRVAALAAMGYTNREIADKLYVTSSTVEQHLTRVYRKLRVRHRQELPSDLTWIPAS